jgi:hypothetical protein
VGAKSARDPTRSCVKKNTPEPEQFPHLETGDVERPLMIHPTEGVEGADRPFSQGCLQMKNGFSAVPKYFLTSGSS